MPAENLDLFRIEKIEHGDGTINATLGINKGSKIFKGHFPGQPVVPGACMLQILKEILEKAVKIPLRLKKADHLKFIKMIDPDNTSSVQLSVFYKPVEEDIIQATAKLISGETVFFKFQGTFIKLI